MRQNQFSANNLEICRATCLCTLLRNSFILKQKNYVQYYYFADENFADNPCLFENVTKVK